MSDPEPQNENPYGIDQERERRLMRLFVISIATAFILAAIALAVAISIDLIIQEDQPVPQDFPSFDEKELSKPTSQEISLHCPVVDAPLVA